MDYFHKIFQVHQALEFLHLLWDEFYLTLKNRLVCINLKTIIEILNFYYKIYLFNLLFQPS